MNEQRLTFDDADLVFNGRSRESGNRLNERDKPSDRLFNVRHFRLEHFLPTVDVDSRRLENVGVFFCRQRLHWSKHFSP